MERLVFLIIISFIDVPGGLIIMSENVLLDFGQFIVLPYFI